MAPVYDPRWSEAAKQRAIAAERSNEWMEWLTPLLMLVIGGGITMTAMALGAASEGGAQSLVALIVAYPVVLAIEVAFGIAGLWLAAKLWMGGAGPLGLGILRLAGIYAATDALWLFVAPLSFVGWLIVIVVYISLLMWQFELEVQDAIVLALITWLLKFAVGFALALASLGA